MPIQTPAHEPQCYINPPLPTPRDAMGERDHSQAPLVGSCAAGQFKVPTFWCCFFGLGGKDQEVRWRGLFCFQLLISLQESVFELSCQNVSAKGSWEKTVTGLDHTKWPAVLELFTWYQLSVPDTVPFYYLVNCFLQRLLFVDLVNCPTFSFPHGLKKTQLAEPRGQFRKEQKNINAFEHYREAYEKFTKECICQGKNAVIMDTGRERHRLKKMRYHFILVNTSWYDMTVEDTKGWS